MGVFDWLRRKPTEQFSDQWSVGDPSLAAWWFGIADEASEIVTPYSVMGLSAVIRAVAVISGTIAGLPLKSYERQGDDREQIPSVFDDPYPGIDGMTPFAWVETVLIHLLLWREAYLWHDSFDSQGNPTSYRPIVPSMFEPVKRRNGKLVFTYTSDTSGLGSDKVEVDSSQVTYIAGPSLDGVGGHPLLRPARAVFSAAISGDKTAQSVLKRGIRLAGLVTPADGEDIEPNDAELILEKLRAKAVGRENAGDIAFVNRRLKLQPWQPNNIESQWHETRRDVIGEIGRLFGLPPHLLNDVEKQTSWGTGVQEQNLGLARYTLMGWTTRIEQALARRLAPDQFLEFDYKGLLQGTPAEEIDLLLKQTGGQAILTADEARKVLNLPPLTPAQKRELQLTPPKPAAPPPPPPMALPDPANDNEAAA